MHTLTTNLFVWVLIAAAFVAVGFSFAQGLGKKLFRYLGIAGGLLALGAGIFCVYFVQTDEKKIRWTLNELRNAAMADDLDAMLALIEEDAGRVRTTARSSVGRAELKSVKFTNFHINEVNRMTSPPRARVSFRLTVTGSTTGEWGGPFLSVVDFDVVELRLHSDGVWRVTDGFHFTFPEGY